MNKRRLSFITGIIFLVQMVSLNCMSLAQDAALNPPTLISLNYFKEVYTVVSLAFSIYKFDAIDGNAKKVIIDKYGAVLLDTDVKFDLEHIDMGKKGWTRYYPVTVNGERFIVRLFLTKERTYQSQMPFLFEMEQKNPAVTCQILPDINSVLDKCSIRPHQPSFDNQVASSL